MEIPNNTKWTFDEFRTSYGTIITPKINGKTPTYQLTGTINSSNTFAVYKSKPVFKITFALSEFVPETFPKAVTAAVESFRTYLSDVMNQSEIFKAMKHCESCKFMPMLLNNNPASIKIEPQIINGAKTVDEQKYSTHIMFDKEKFNGTRKELLEKMHNKTFLTQTSGYITFFMKNNEVFVKYNLLAALMKEIHSEARREEIPNVDDILIREMESSFNDLF